MGFNWIKVQYWRSRCPEIVRISSETNRSRHEVLGMLCDFWSWCSCETLDGRIPGVYLKNLPDVLGFDAAFWEAVRKVNWIDQDSDGLVVTNWEHWLSESSKKRVTEALRKKIARVSSAEKRPQNVRKVSGNKRPKKQYREEKSREEIKEDLKPSAVPKTAPTDRVETAPDLHNSGSEKPIAERPRDLLFDAIAEVTGSSPAIHGARIGKVKKTLLSEKPPYTPEEVYRFGELCRTGAECGFLNGRKPSLANLVEYISRVRNPSKPNAARPRYETPEQRMLRQIREANGSTQNDPDSQEDTREIAPRGPGL